MNGVIWNKMKKTFMPISSVPVYAMLQQERLRQSRILETYNFQKQNLTLTSFQESHFFEFYDNDMKVTGLCGELWNLLSEKLNFTLQPIRSNETGVGAQDKNLTYSYGLLSVILRNRTMAIPKLETYSVRLLAADFTMPLWMNSQRLYIQHEIVHDSAWMAKVFSWKIWCCILVTYLLLSVCSFWSQIVLTRLGNNYRRTSIGDHIFYNFGMICNQNNIPDILVGRSKILEVSLGLFCSLLYMAFGAVLFIFITKRVNVIPPFHNLESLRTDTTYNVVVLKSSMGDIVFQKSVDQEFVQIKMAKRVNIALTAEQMYKMACGKSTKKYIMLQGEDEHKTRDKICHTIPIGPSYAKIWIASGIIKNFKYKRTFDLGILKLKEIGLWDILKDRWLYEKFLSQDIDNRPKGIGLDQIFLIILMMCCGIITALIIFVIEKIVYAYKFKLS